MRLKKALYFVIGGLFIVTPPAWSLVVQINNGINARYRDGKVVSNVGKEGTRFVLKPKSLIEIDDKYVIRKNGRVDFKATFRNWKSDKNGGCELNKIAFTPRWDYYCPLKVIQQGPHSRLKENTDEVFLAVDYMAKYDYMTVVDDGYLNQVKASVSEETQEIEQAELKAEEAPTKSNEVATVLNPSYPKSEPQEPSFTGRLLEDVSGSQQGLSCRQESDQAARSGLSQTNTCEEVKMQLAPIDSNKFRQIPAGRRRAQAFVDWIKPMAQYFQAKTGMPASVIVAQAALETGWGTSYLFRRDNSMFGHSCWSQGQRRSFSLKTGDEELKARGTCARQRPEGGYYLRFESHEDSVLAYLNNLLQADNNYYNELRASIKRARSENPLQPAQYQDVTAGLSNYASSSYPAYIRKMIRQFNLDELDQSDCQKCLTLAGRNLDQTRQNRSQVSQTINSSTNQTVR